MTTKSYKHTAGKPWLNQKPGSTRYTTIHTPNEDHSMIINGHLEVNGRNILKELDKLNETMLVLESNVKIFDKYPELKQAYDDYNEMYRGILIAEKMATLDE